MLRGRVILLLENKKRDSLVSWFAGFFVSSFLGFLVSSFLGCKVTTVQRIEVSKDKSGFVGKMMIPYYPIVISCLMEDMNPTFKLFIF